MDKIVNQPGPTQGQKEEIKFSKHQINAIIESQNHKVDESKRKTVMCSHWLNGYCKYGENCDYLHVFVE